MATRPPVDKKRTAPPAARRRTGVRGTAAVWGTAALLLLPPPPAASQSPPPDADWRTLETDHFRVTFPAGLDSLAARTAAVAEEAWSELGRGLVETPDGVTDLLLTDHVDVSNGYAGVAPYRRVVVFARPPVDGFALSYFDDWMDLVVTHELAHVVHLEVTGGLGRFLRGVFGRVPAPWPFFPNLGTPRWVVEGLATWYETDLTGSGRTHGSYHDMVVRTALLEDRFESIDQASGDSPAWPAGNRSYVYGSLFFDWLLEEHGAEHMGEFVRAVGDQIVPYRLNSAAKKAFGVSFSDAWREWEGERRSDLAELTRSLGARAPLTDLEPVTDGARLAVHPQVGPGGRRLAYLRVDGRSDAQIRVGPAGGVESEKWTRVNGAADFSWTPGGDLVLAQLEFEDPYRLFSDLWRLSPSGETDRLTRGERLDQPTVAPDGRAAVAVRSGDGSTDLVEVDLETGAVRLLGEAEDDVHWAFPAVSPDGRWIAAVRWERGAANDLVVLDREGGEVARVTRDRAVDLAPAWSPEGRWLLWTSDRSGIANAYAVEVDPSTGAVEGPLRQVTNVLTGVGFPSVSPDGRWIHLSVYHADGWDVERMPYDPAGWFEPLPADPHLGAPAAAGEGPAAPLAAPVEDYGPLATLRPRYWEPLYREGRDVAFRDGTEQEVMGPSYGFATSGRDLVGRHAFDLSAVFSTSGGRSDFRAGYAWAGLGNPVLSVRVDQEYDVGGPLGGERQDGSLDTLFLRERERAASVGAAFAWPTYRTFRSLSASVGMVWEDRTLLDSDLDESEAFRLERPSSRLADASVSLSISNARGHAFSLGGEEGASLFVRGRRRFEVDVPDSLSGVIGGDRSYSEVLGRVRAFRSIPGFGFADHVLALRASGGAAGGPGADRFHFDVGGASGRSEALTGFGLFGGSGYFFPVRGYENGERSGRYAWSATAEYRVPLWLVNRGWGLLPLHVDRIQAAAFADAGNAWGPELGEPFYQNPRDDALVSAGAELQVRTLAFWALSMDVRLGVAVPFQEGREASVYVRLGNSF